MTFVAAGVFAAEAPQTTHEPLPPLPPQVAGPATAPANEARIRQWFADLADTNPSVRDRARVALMGIKVEELGALRAVADASRPLAPAQAAVLHDVVIHVYAGGTRVRAFQNEIEVSLKFGAEPQPRFGKSGFLGVLLEPVISGFGVGAPRAPAPDGADENQPDFIQLRTSGGVLIRETWPGFAGFRFLRVGDVVLGTGGAEPTRAPTVQELRGTVQGTPPDGTLDLSVLRQGRIVDVPITVSARPAWAEDEFTTRQMQSRRLRRAALYWQFAFAPLLLKDDGML
jgi:hypothetical protein